MLHTHNKTQLLPKCEFNLTVNYKKGIKQKMVNDNTDKKTTKTHSTHDKFPASMPAFADTELEDIIINTATNDNDENIADNEVNTSTISDDSHNQDNTTVNQVANSENNANTASTTNKTTSTNTDSNMNEPVVSKNEHIENTTITDTAVADNTTDNSTITDNVNKSDNTANINVNKSDSNVNAHNVSTTTSIPPVAEPEIETSEQTPADKLADMGADLFTSKPEPKHEPTVVDEVLSNPSEFTDKNTLLLATMNVLNRDDNYLNRVDGIMSMLINHAHTDVICFQEVRLDKINEFADMLNERGYGFTWRREPMHNKLDTVGIAYNMRSMHMIGSSEPVYGVEALKAHLVYNNDDTRHIGVITYHGDWGATMQASRLRELSVINRLSVSMSRYPVVLAGDFNARPNERSIRYIRGESEGLNDKDWAYWIEAQDMKESLIGSKPFMTSLNTGLATMTAANQGIDASYYPERRIDYIFTHGFTYGKQGGFTGDASTYDGFINDDGTWVGVNMLSDHRPVLASIIFKHVDNKYDNVDPFAD